MMRGIPAKNETLIHDAQLPHTFSESSSSESSAEAETIARQVRIAEIRSRLSSGSYRMDSAQIATKLMESMAQAKTEPARPRNPSDQKLSGDG